MTSSKPPKVNIQPVYCSVGAVIPFAFLTLHDLTLYFLMREERRERGREEVNIGHVCLCLRDLWTSVCACVCVLYLVCVCVFGVGISLQPDWILCLHYSDRSVRG